MIISEAELQRRLNSGKNLVNTLSLPASCVPAIVVVDEKLPDVIAPATDAQKTLAASLYRQGVPALVVAQELNITPKEVKAVGTKEVRSAVEHSMEKIRELALDKLMFSLGLMTPEKFENANLKDISVALRALSQVVSVSAPKVEESGNLHLHVYAPQARAMGQYKVIDV